MEDTRTDRALPGGKPHLLTLLPFVLVLPLSGAAVWLLWRREGSSAVFLYTAAGILLLSGAAVGAAIAERAVCRWEVRDNVLILVDGLMRRRTVHFRLDRLLLAEVKQGLLTSFCRCARVRLYAAGKKNFCSLLLSESDADALFHRTVAGKDGKAGHTKRMVSGRWAAALGALDSRAVWLPLSASLFCGAAGIVSAVCRRTALVLLITAAVTFTARLLKEGHMSVEITERGFSVRMGPAAARRLFIPHAAVTGVLESRGPIAMTCGAGRFELVCGGGIRVPCMRWYEGRCGREAAGRLLGCDGPSRVRVSDAGGLRKHYARLTAAGMLAAVCVFLVFTVKGNPPAAILSLWTGTVWQMHCRMGLGFAEETEVGVSAGALWAGGMRPLRAERLTVRRGFAGTFRLRFGPGAVYRETCAAELVPEGSRHGVTCAWVPQGRMLAMTERFV